MSLDFPKRFLFLACLALSIVSLADAQSASGKLTGKVVDDNGGRVVGVTVIVTNQTSGEIFTKVTTSDGRYSFNLRAGAYRITVGPPFEARFGQGKTAEYGVFSNLFCDRKKEKCPILENVIIDGSERKIEIKVAKAEASTEQATDKKETEVQANSDRREVRDRWRYEFPEYDRYGDKGARGRDIPFKRNRWYNPYDQNVLKGDYPIFGNDYFMILSGVSTTGSRSAARHRAIMSARRPRQQQFFWPSREPFVQPDHPAVVRVFQGRDGLQTPRLGDQRSRRPSACRIILTPERTAS